MTALRFTAFLAAPRFTAFLAALRFTAFLAAPRFTAFLAALRFTAFLAALRFTAFLAALRFTAFLTAARFTAFLATLRFTAFLTAARFTAFLTAARFTALRTARTGTTSTLHCRSFRREALCARDNRFELSAGPECRHGRWLHFHCLARARITRNAGCTTALFENAETGNGDAVTLMYRTHDGVDDVLHRCGCLPTIVPSFSVSTSMSSALFMQNLRNQWSTLDRLEDTVIPLALISKSHAQFQALLAADFGNPLAPHGRWSGV